MDTSVVKVRSHRMRCIAVPCVAARIRCERTFSLHWLWSQRMLNWIYWKLLFKYILDRIEVVYKISNQKCVAICW